MGINSLKNRILKFIKKSDIGTNGLNKSLLKENIKYSSFSFSQEGEDMILNRFFENKLNGFYIDIGAHHPKRFSNTYNFYAKGWRGINIDAMPKSMDVFNIERPNDINLEIAISNKKGEQTYYMFNEPALNTLSNEEAMKKDGLLNYKIVERIEVKTHPLKEVLDKYLENNQKIDFMTIDVEGLDLEVLETNNWEKYRPTIVLVEDLNKTPLLDLPSKSRVYKYMNDNNYTLVAKTFNTLFFKDNLS